MRALMTRKVLAVWCLLLAAAAQEKAQPLEVDSNLMTPKVRIAPLYPRGARAKGLKGKVSIRIWISADGRVEKTEVKEGNRELGQAAMDAIRYWTYEPYTVNGQPVRVLTTVIVNFK